MKQGWVYILSNKKHGTLYIGVTSDLKRRMYQHKNRMIDGFSRKYQLTKLVYFEQSNEVVTAIQREKQLKNWRRAWKIALIEKGNPEWLDLATGWFDGSRLSSA